MSFDVTRLMWDEMGESHHEIEVVPWAQDMVLLDTVPGVVLFGAGWSEGRARQYNYVKPIMDVRYVIMARAGEDVEPWEALTGGYGAMVGSIRDDVTERVALARGFPLNRFDRASRLEVTIRNFLAGGFDYVLGEHKALELAIA